MFIQEFLSHLYSKSTILDTACGAGRYEPSFLEKGQSIIGVDQSQDMLAGAKEKFPDVRYETSGLQEVAYRQIFDGVICVDAMEKVCPEDWPLVLSNFHRALKPQVYLYFTAETIENADENGIEQAYEKAKQAGRQLFMESGRMKKSIIIIRRINKSKGGFSERGLKSKKS